MSQVEIKRQRLEDPSIFLSSAATYLKVNLEPIVDTRSGKLVACEALMRGFRDMGFETPHQLLDHAHAIGALLDLELFLARSAIQALQNTQSSRPRLFLNIDGRSLPEWKRYRERLNFYVQEAGMSPAEICIEISEAQQVLDDGAFEDAVAGLRDIGLRIAVDDFGTGVSGLRMLYLTRPNFLKIDRFFIRKMPVDAQKRLLVQAIARLANTLGAQVIAEGVETRDELQAVRQAECSLVQGYLIKGQDSPFLRLETEYQLPDNEAPQATMDARLQKVMQTPRTFEPDVKLQQLFESYQKNDLGEVIPIVDKSSSVIGVLTWQKLRKILGSRYGDALAQNPSFNFRIQDFTDRLPSIDVSQPLSAAIDLVADDARDGVVVLRQGLYLGYLSPFDLMHLANTIRTVEAQRRNPLTGLNGNDYISEIIRTSALSHHKHRAFFYIDIANFKPFNDKFGFELGDRAIMILSEQLQRAQEITGASVGHIGGDDFFLAACDDSIAPLQSILELMPDKYYNDALHLVPSDYHDAGHYLGSDRSGQNKKIPLISCTVAGLRFAPGKQDFSPREIAEALSALKSQARKAGTSYLVEDR